MKKYVIILICLIIPTLIFGQNETKQVDLNVEEVKVSPPKFTRVLNADELFNVGNSSAIEKYLAKNFICPVNVVCCKNEGTEIIRFTVTPNGWITNIKVINSVCREVDKELISLLERTNSMWMPGTNNGEPVAMEQEVSLMIGDYSQDEIINQFVRKAEKCYSQGSSTLFVDHKPKKALRYFNESVRYLPNDKGLLLMRGICNYELGNTEKARTDWNRIVSLGGIDMGSHYGDLAEMKGYKDMTRILAAKDKN